MKILALSLLLPLGTADLSTGPMPDAGARPSPATPTSKPDPAPKPPDPKAPEPEPAKADAALDDDVKPKPKPKPNTIRDSKGRHTQAIQPDDLKAPAVDPAPHQRN